MNHSAAKFGLLLSALAFGSAHAADWALDNSASKLNFISIKAGNVAENHTFGSLAGSIGESGTAELTIALDSVNTAIDVRDERMRTLLFDTSAHPQATISAQIDTQVLAALPSGATTRMSVAATLDIGGQQSPLTAELEVIKLNESTLVVSTHTPILLNATHVGLEAGVEKLREVAGLSAISLAVPVTFTLVFKV